MTPPPRTPNSPTPPAQGQADERDFEAFAQGQDPLDIAAATWALRRRHGLNAQERAELQAWLEADPRHGEALDDMAGTLGDLQQLPDEDVAALKAGLPAAPEPARPTSVKPRSAPSQRWSWPSLAPLVPRMAIATFAFMLMGGGLLGWNHWRQLPTFEQAYATTRGQRLTINLPDAGQRKGTIVQLDTSSHADARLYRDRREVLLKDGQAMLTVASDASKPFQVRAGALRITVVGTRFSVRHTKSGLDAGQTVVSVEEGHVRVERASQASGNDLVNLTAGQQVVADAMGRIGPVQRIPVTAIALWRSGRISFEQTPLAQAVAEFERYGHTGLLVRDPAVAALPIGGSYNLQQFQQFVETLPQVLPVKLVPQGNVMEVVAR